jgi:hypothetical protein
MPTDLLADTAIRNSKPKAKPYGGAVFRES